MQKLHTVKIFSLLLLCVLLLSLISTVGAKTYHAFFPKDSFNEGTKVGPVDEQPEENENNNDQFVEIDESNVVSQSVIRNLKDENEIIKWVREFDVVHLPANKPFSLLSFLLESGTSTKFSNEALSVIATGIYSTILSSNFEIIERHISDQFPYYATFGFEAMIENENKDLILNNINPHEYRLVFSFEDHEFNVQLMGPDLQQSIHVVIADEESFEPKIIKQFDSTLSKGKKVVKQKGISGQVGKIYRIFSEVGVVDEKIKVAEDFYPPSHTIEAHSILVPEAPQNPIWTEPEGILTNPDGTPGPTNGSNEENNLESGNGTDEDNEEKNIDLWENPDPIEKS
ncbi:VanW family protein [Bacillus sp. JJ1521]|uniref:G5 domain-containing protein n=1 Tax=Bacillus sp. JJ1521 TaxID=3122957 RepID=UPI003000C405